MHEKKISGKKFLFSPLAVNEISMVGDDDINNSATEKLSIMQFKTAVIITRLKKKTSYKILFFFFFFLQNSNSEN